MSKRPLPPRGKRDGALCRFCGSVAAPGYPVCQAHKSRLSKADLLYLDQQRAKVRAEKAK